MSENGSGWIYSLTTDYYWMWNTACITFLLIHKVLRYNFKTIKTVGVFDWRFSRDNVVWGEHEEQMYPFNNTNMIDPYCSQWISLEVNVWKSVSQEA